MRPLRRSSGLTTSILLIPMLAVKKRSAAAMGSLAAAATVSVMRAERGVMTSETRLVR